MPVAAGNSYAVASGEAIYAGRAAPVILWSGDVVVAGDSLTALTYQSGGYRWGLPLTMCPPRVIYNAGVANDTIQNLIDRLTPDVLSKIPAVVMLRIGTNSLALSTAAFRAKYRELIDLILAAGINIMMHAIPPKSGITGSLIVAHNDWIADQATENPTRLRYVGDSSALGDGSYTYIPAYYIDGTHMNGKGGRRQGLDMAPDYIAQLTQVDPRLTAPGDVAGQWVANPLMTGTAGTLAGGATGTVPTSWKVSTNGSGTTAVASIVAADVGDAVQAPWMRIAVTASGGSTHSVTADSRLVHPAIAADATVKRIDMVAEVRFVDFNPINVTSARMFVDSSGAEVAQNLSLAMGDLGTLNERVVMRHSLPRNQSGAALAAYAANSLDVNIKLTFSAAFASGIGYCDIRCVSARGQDN